MMVMSLRGDTTSGRQRKAARKSSTHERMDRPRAHCLYMHQNMRWADANGGLGSALPVTDLQVDVRGQGSITCVHPQDGLAGRHIGGRHKQQAVKAAGSE